MNNILSIAKKELRGYFYSPVAMIFLATFLIASFVVLFWIDKFFALGVADLKPFFARLPLLLIFLVSALSMRFWSEERKTGTLELLLTLPVPSWQLVVGKFVAGLALVALALGLTLGLPITVAQLGNLDWGPVWGGYLAALLLAAAYLALGMCVSAVTDNQIVALIGTMAIGAVFYFIGYAGEYFPWLSGALGALGAGTRFESVARGVVDLRDLAYYGSLAVAGVALCVYLLRQQAWAKSQRSQARRRSALAVVALVAVNAILLNVWLTPVGRARLDLTEFGEYSLSTATKAILANAEQPILVRGYFSAKTHPKLAPLIPRIRDLLDEYGAVSGGNLRVEFIEPSSDEDKKEADELYQVRPTPLRVETADERAQVKSYFHVVVAIGKEHETLGLEQLVAVQPTADSLSVEVGNLEYEVTRAIKKLQSGFHSATSVFASLASPVEVTLYVTPQTLPPPWADGPSAFRDAIAALKAEAGDKIVFNEVAPAGDAEMQKLFEEFGLQPRGDLATGQVFYFDPLIKVGGRYVRMLVPEKPTKDLFKDDIVAAIVRGAPGFTKTIGVWSPPTPPAPPADPSGRPQRPQGPPQQFEMLTRELRRNYDVELVSLTAPVRDNIDVLILGGPANLSEAEARAVDQFVMRGGALIALAGRYRLDIEALQMGDPRVAQVETGLDKVLAKWGITIPGELVMDPKGDSFPAPMRVGGRVEQGEPAPYPFFVKVQGEGKSSSMITGPLLGAVMHWSSPVRVEATVGTDKRTVETLLRSSSGAWLGTDGSMTAPAAGFAPASDLAADKKGAMPVAVSIIGGFASAFADAPAPNPAGDAAAGANANTTALLKHSPNDTRMVIFGSSVFASDDAMQLSQQLQSALGAANLQLVQNAVDWALADADLLSIRARGAGLRAFTIDDDKRAKWRWINIGLAALALAGVVAWSHLRRAGIRPLTTKGGV